MCLQDRSMKCCQNTTLQFKQVAQIAPNIIFNGYYEMIVNGEAIVPSILCSFSSYKFKDNKELNAQVP